VILLENSNEWNLSLAKRRILKKGARIKKPKEVKPHTKSSIFQKERRKRG
jgi:hypothetical protein